MCLQPERSAARSWFGRKASNLLAVAATTFSCLVLITLRVMTPHAQHEASSQSHSPPLAYARGHHAERDEYYGALREFRRQGLDDRYGFHAHSDHLTDEAEDVLRVVVAVRVGSDVMPLRLSV